MRRSTKFTALLLLTGVAGCGGDPSTAEHLLTAREPPFFSEPDTRRHTGDLDVDDTTRCVTFTPNDDGPIPVLAPYGTELTDKGTMLEIPDLGSYRLGSEATLDGTVVNIIRPVKEVRPTAWDICIGAESADVFTITPGH